MIQSLQYKNKHNKMAINTIKNASISVLLAVLVISFELIKNILTSRAFGIDSLGLLTIVMGILPYINNSHNSMISVATAKLYAPMHYKNYAQVNKDIANLRPQFYLFGGFYISIIVILAFAFPFIAGNNGVIIVNDGMNHYDIKWYESTIFILSNVINLVSTYFIIPFSFVLLFIVNKAYIYNSYNIVISILFNMIIIMLFILQMNGIINLSFIHMSIISFTIIGTKTLILILILIPYRKKLFPWLKKEKITSYKIRKESSQSMISSYLNQFSSDAISILLLVFASLYTSSSPSIFNIDLRHGNHGGGEISNFLPSAIYSTFLMLLMYGQELVHSIVDAAIPSIAEHASFNNFKINKHFFHRYQMLSVFIACFSASSFLLSGIFFQSLFLEIGENQFHDLKIMNMIISLLWIPVVIETFTSMYDHIITIFNKFDKILIISVIKAVSSLILIIIVPSIVFTCVDQTKWIYSIIGTILSVNIFSNLLAYIYARKIAMNYIKHDSCVRINYSTVLCFIWVIITYVISILIINLTDENIFHIIKQNGLGITISIPILIVVANFIINIINIMIFRKDDFMYYINEIKNEFILKNN